MTAEKIMVIALQIGGVIALSANRLDIASILILEAILVLVYAIWKEKEQ